ncbi:MAG: alcohol dehydrogenase catalytic domain-containing protein, partial [Planctomycetes bacterium]|nr:alcohol dehydrogenase catalytic domain-containing protein [Planctomycetota bacterium]
MRSAVVAGPGNLAVVDVPRPVVGDYDALCELLWGATCSGTDRHIIDGNFPWTSPLPTILGHESVGRVVAIGARVRNLRLGDVITRVGTPPVAGYSTTWGGFAEWGIAKDHWAMAADGLPEAQWNAYRVNQVLPTSIDPRVGPMFITWRETYSYLKRTGIDGRSRVLIAGSGGNGLAFAAHAVNLGCVEVAMVGSASRRDLATRRLGVHAYHDHRQVDLTAVLGEAHRDGFDLIIDAVGRSGLAERLLPRLRPQGAYAIYGLDDIANFAINPLCAPHPFTLRGGGDYNEAEAHHAICDLVQRGRLDASAWYDP